MTAPMAGGTDVHHDQPAGSIRVVCRDAIAVTREHKLALIVGFALVLVLGVLISDHFSKARQVEMAGASDIRQPTARQMGASTNGARPISDGMAGSQPITGSAGSSRPDLVALPGVVQPLPQDAPRGTQLTMSGGTTYPLVETRNLAPNAGPDGYHPESSPSPAVPQIPLTRYDVKDGDTLYGIAAKVYGQGGLWEKVREYNKDKLSASGTIHKGVTLMLPPKDVLLGKPYVPVAQTLPPQSSTPQNGQLTNPSTLRGDQSAQQPPIAKPTDYKEYVVKEGDTLTSIARKMLNSGKRVNDLIEANKATLPDPESLSVGMKLRIPVK